MGKVLLILSVLLSHQAFALECEQEVSDYFADLNESRQYLDFGISNKIYTVEEAEQSWKQEIYNASSTEKVGIYYGYSDYMGGYGVEAIVFNRESCDILKTVEVYTE